MRKEIHDHTRSAAGWVSYLRWSQIRMGRQADIWQTASRLSFDTSSIEPVNIWGENHVYFHLDRIFRESCCYPKSV